MNKDRTPPHDTEIERAVLGSILLGGFEAVYESITPNDFYSRAHRRIFEAMQNMSKAGIAIEPLALITELKKAGMYEEAGGEYAKALCDVVPSNANAEYYTNAVLNYSRKRSLLKLASEITVAAYDESTYAQEIVNKALIDLNELKER